MVGACSCISIRTSLRFVGLDNKLQGALEKVLGKPKELVHVDMGAKLTVSGLKSHFPVAAWPPSTAVFLASVCCGTCDPFGRCASWRQKCVTVRSRAKRTPLFIVNCGSALRAAIVHLHMFSSIGSYLLFAQSIWWSRKSQLRPKQCVSL